MSSLKRFLMDLAERTVATFLQVLSATFAANATGVVDVDILTNLKLSLGAAVLAVLKGLSVRSIGAKGTAAALPLAADAASAVLDSAGKVVGTLTEPVPVLDKVGDRLEEGIDRATDKLGDASVAGAKRVESVLGRIFGRGR